jgi:hypothetical protein
MDLKMNYILLNIDDLFINLHGICCRLLSGCVSGVSVRKSSENWMAVLTIINILSGQSCNSREYQTHFLCFNLKYLSTLQVFDYCITFSEEVEEISVCSRVLVWSLSAGAMDLVQTMGCTLYHVHHFPIFAFHGCWNDCIWRVTHSNSPYLLHCWWAYLRRTTCQQSGKLGWQIVYTLNWLQGKSVPPLWKDIVGLPAKRFIL